jgi:hypothetical protein
LFDARYFAGAPYSWDGDWTNSSEPAVAKDLKIMGFGVVRASVTTPKLP